jgi:hypothetical protein
MFTRRSMFALVALAATAASIMASPALAGGHGGHRLRNITVGRVPPPSCPGGCIKKNVGQGDTIDGIPWGSQPGNGTPLNPGDGAWGTNNGNLPGKGAYGN